MQNLSLNTLAYLVDAPVSSNLMSLHEGLRAYGKEADLSDPRCLVSYLAQVSHESQDFRYDREIWGPTAAQKRYDTRTDLGNTPELDGDGKFFSGRTAMQITGRANTREFRDWCRARFPAVPDFERFPDKMNTNPWEGLGPIWFWVTRKLAVFARSGDFRAMTRKINGGYNGLDDRNRRFGKIALRVLYPEPISISEFQSLSGLTPDGVCGTRTIKALSNKLRLVAPFTFDEPDLPLPSYSSRGLFRRLVDALLSLLKGKSDA